LNDLSPPLLLLLLLLLLHVVLSMDRWVIGVMRFLFPLERDTLFSRRVSSSTCWEPAAAKNPSGTRELLRSIERNDIRAKTLR